MRKPVIAGNWKMYKTIAEAVDFIEKIKPVAEKATHCEVIVAPPYTALAAAAGAAKGSKVAISAQDVHWDKEGAQIALDVEKACEHCTSKDYYNALTYICTGNSCVDFTCYCWIGNSSLLGNFLSKAIHATWLQKTEAMMRMEGLV